MDSHYARSVQKMNLAELDRKAIELATRSLQRGFDWQAYLVYKMAVMPAGSVSEQKDVVPESTADEGMAEVIGLFAQYAACKRGKVPEAETLNALEAVTDRLRRVIIEMYHLCGSEKERKIVRDMKSKLP